MTKIERIVGTDSWRVTIDHIEHRLSEPAFLQLAQQMLDKIQVIKGERDLAARAKEPK